MATASLREPDLAPAGGEASLAPVILDLCVICNENPRAGSGRLTRCMACIRHEAERDRQDRLAAEAKLAALAKSEQPVKKCETCRVEKPLSDYFRHRLAKDGRRRSCISCVRSGTAKKAKPLTAQQRAADKARRAKPDRRAQNLEAVLRWQARNGDAIEAHRAVDRAVRAGEVVPAKVCQAAGCKRRRVSSHHNSYAANRRKTVIWLCQQHHRIVHAGRNVSLKRTAPTRFAKAPRTV